MRDFTKPCWFCRTNSIETIIPKDAEIRKNHPYLNGFPEYCCKSCIIKAQTDYIKGVPLEDVPLLLSTPWVYPEGMHEKIKERLGY